MTLIKCSRCGGNKEGLKEAPYNNELGQKILVQTCQDCWNHWVSQQLMIMNEYRLDPLKDDHSKFLDKEMKEFLNLN